MKKYKNLIFQIKLPVLYENGFDNEYRELEKLSQEYVNLKRRRKNIQRKYEDFIEFGDITEGFFKSARLPKKDFRAFSKMPNEKANI